MFRNLSYKICSIGLSRSKRDIMNVLREEFQNVDNWYVYRTSHTSSECLVEYENKNISVRVQCHLDYFSNHKKLLFFKVANSGLYEKNIDLGRLNGWMRKEFKRKIHRVLQKRKQDEENKNILGKMLKKS